MLNQFFPPYEYFQAQCQYAEYCTSDQNVKRSLNMFQLKSCWFALSCLINEKSRWNE